MRATVFSGIFLLLSATALPQTQTQTRVPSGRAVLEAYVSAWNRHDFAALDKILAPDAVHEDIALGVYARGIAQIKGFMQKVIQGQPDLEWRVSRFVESGPITVAEWTWSSTFTGESPRGPVEKQRVFGRESRSYLRRKARSSISRTTTTSRAFFVRLRLWQRSAKRHFDPHAWQETRDMGHWPH